MKPIFAMSDERFAAVAGFDALTFIRFLSLCARISAIIAFFALLVLLPLNWTSDNVNKIQGIQKVSCAEKAAEGEKADVRSSRRMLNRLVSASLTSQAASFCRHV
jgi:hypothetical protein